MRNRAKQCLLNMADRTTEILSSHSCGCLYNMHKIKPVNILTRSEKAFVRSTPDCGLWTVDGFLGKDGPFCLRVWVLVGRPWFNGWSHTWGYTDNTNWSSCFYFWQKTLSWRLQGGQMDVWGVIESSNKWIMITIIV